MKSRSLRRALIVPFVLLTAALSTITFWVSNRSAEQAADEFSRQVLFRFIERVNQATAQQLTGARTTLRAVAPDPIRTTGAPLHVAFPKDFETLENRLWVATSLHQDVPRYVYFGGADGRFIGINRTAARIELRLRKSGELLRNVYEMKGPGQRGAVISTQVYEPRDRPWYTRAITAGKETWSQVYNDFMTHEPTLTLAKPVYTEQGEPMGVVATDMYLTTLTEFFRTLDVSKHGIAFLMEPSGAIVATTSNELPFRQGDREMERLFASQSKSEFLREVYQRVATWTQKDRPLTSPVSGEFEIRGEKIQIAIAPVKEDAGIDWISVVAVPRSDFLTDLTSLLYKSLLIGVACVVATMLVGLALLRPVIRDIKKLTKAARELGSGHQARTLGISRTDEIGELAKNIEEIERVLHTDDLTQLSTREALLSHIKEKISRPGEQSDFTFGLLFIDLNGFKGVNDRLGHAAGDQVLIEVGNRIRRILRANDEVARFGGDEFVIYIHDVRSQSDCRRVAEKLKSTIRQPISFKNGGTVTVGASIGIAIYPHDGMDVTTLVNAADKRMYLEKAVA